MWIWTPRAVAAEFIDVTHEGIELAKVPEGDLVERLIREANIPTALRISA